jgi:hypothetical protein
MPFRKRLSAPERLKLPRAFGEEARGEAEPFCVGRT